MLSREEAAKWNIVGHLERICQKLELTETQYELAEQRYQAVGEWLASSEHPALQRTAQIYPQGSISLGTSVKPLRGNEYDVDLVCFVPSATPETPPWQLKQLIGERLRENRNYEPILQEKPRCWRLDYANEFHLDITPSITNPQCPNGGELVPDKIKDEWKASNPIGYKKLFSARAKLEPIYHLFKAANRMFESAGVAPFPSNDTRFKGTLRRGVQIIKRHRDEYSLKKGPDFAPISIILTTLASQSYEQCIKNNNNGNGYATEFDVLLDVVHNMPLFIKSTTTAQGMRYWVNNETTKGENFAEKWNSDSRFAHCFYDWHGNAVADLGSLASQVGADNLRKAMNSCFGERVVASAFEDEISSVADARARGLLSVVPGVGLATAGTQGLAGKSVRIGSNTFFGGP